MKRPANHLLCEHQQQPFRWIKERLARSHHTKACHGCHQILRASQASHSTGQVPNSKWPTNAGIAIINHPYFWWRIPVWWLGGWFIIAIPTSYFHHQKCAAALRWRCPTPPCCIWSTWSHNLGSQFFLDLAMSASLALRFVPAPSWDCCFLAGSNPQDLEKTSFSGGVAEHQKLSRRIRGLNMPYTVLGEVMCGDLFLGANGWVIYIQSARHLRLIPPTKNVSSKLARSSWQQSLANAQCIQ